MVYAFISDLHLCPSDIVTDRIFSQFLEKIEPSVDRLYILGDLFDRWYGQEKEPYYHSVLSRLSHFSAQKPVYFLPGNRDFLLSHSVCSSYHLKKITDFSSLNLGPYRLLLCHGDTLCTSDYSYQYMRSIIQNPFIQRLFLAMPYLWRENLAHLVQRSSQSISKTKHQSQFDICHQMVDKKLEDNQANLMIHGHIHQFQQHNHNNCTRIVLDAWQPNANYLTLDDSGQMNYYHFDGNLSQLIYQQQLT